MIVFILWFLVLVGLIKFTKGWTRGLLIAAFVFGSLLVAL